MKTTLRETMPAGGKTPGRVLVAMSGGVDSSVAALLLREAGWDCLGVMMRFLESSNCDALAAGTAITAPGAADGIAEYAANPDDNSADAAAVAARLEIPFRIADCRSAFRAQVIEQFIRAYEAGLTPNPCIDCNRTMKFGKLLDLALAEGCTHLATGHYAQVSYDKARGRYVLRKAADASKDQSYVLYMLSQAQLSHLLLPLGGLTKTEIRAIAEDRGLVTAHKEESQDICFVPDGDYAGFMEACTGRTYPTGDFLDMSGKVVGRHSGAIRYTTGQRKGLGLALGTPVYVQGKDMQANTVTVGPEESLFRTDLTADAANWIAIADLTAPLRVLAMPRYRKKAAPATLYPLPDENPGTAKDTVAGDSACSRLRVVFDEPQRAMTPGQAIVFYDMDEPDLVVGGATIRAVG